MRCLTLAAVVALCSLGSGCDEDRQRCTEACPRVDGSYAILTAGPHSATCSFEPYLLGSSLVIEQSADTSTVSASIIDPVNQLILPLTGYLVVPPDGAVAILSLRAQTTRQATYRGPSELLEVDLHATVYDADDHRRLDGDLTTTNLPLPDAGTLCTVMIPFNARR